MLYELLPMILSLSVFIISFSMFQAITLKMKLHKKIKEGLSLIFFSISVFIFLFVFTLIKNADFSNLNNLAYFLASLLLIITIVSICYIIALYIEKVDRFFKLKLDYLKRKEIILVNLGLLFLSFILGIYFGFLLLILKLWLF